MYQRSSSPEIPDDIDSLRSELYRKGNIISIFLLGGLFGTLVTGLALMPQWPKFNGEYLQPDDVIKPRAVQVVDTNHDGIDDLIISSGISNDSTQKYIFLGQKDGRYIGREE